MQMHLRQTAASPKACDAMQWMKMHAKGCLQAMAALGDSTIEAHLLNAKARCILPRNCWTTPMLCATGMATACELGARPVTNLVSVQ